MINLILDQLNVFFLGILILRRDTSVTHLLFVFISIVLMPPFMNLNPIFLLPLVVTVLSPVSLLTLRVSCYYSLETTPSEIVVRNNLQLRLLPHLVIRLLTLTLFTLFCSKVSILVHPISQFVSYGHLSLALFAFTTSVSSVVVPKSVQEATSIPS